VRTLTERKRVPTNTFVLDRSETAPNGKLFLPVHPVRAVTAIVDADGGTLPRHQYLVDAALGIVRCAGNTEFRDYPYTVTVAR
jgi:hypothetical protein